MAEDRISYEMLQDMLRSERRSNKLSPVQTRFWHDVRDFLDEVMATFREEQKKDPFSRRVMMVTDEVKHAQQAAESLWALRERKMSLFALSQVRDPNPKRPDGLTPDEERIYDHVLAALHDGRQMILEGAKLPAKRKVEPAQTPAPPAAKPAAGEATPVPEPPSGPTSEPAPEPKPTEVPADTPDTPLVTIRALSDIPAFVGPDMQTYLLKEGDVATVPEPIAALLEKRKKAAPIDVTA